MITGARTSTLDNKKRNSLSCSSCKQGLFADFYKGNGKGKKQQKENGQTHSNTQNEISANGKTDEFLPEEKPILETPAFIKINKIIEAGI